MSSPKPAERKQTMKVRMHPKTSPSVVDDSHLSKRKEIRGEDPLTVGGPIEGHVDHLMEMVE